ncbi:Protein Njmu-R1 [Acropora cervicornis]|uniref:Protein Njmu-R1 n=1 Tax=Acropora cervicornis TaxID=6130 RepID=A0AAD9VF65_ACRCE|nr:Protein Njmu-R1 [Acropora cervicornis]
MEFRISVPKLPNPKYTKTKLGSLVVAKMEEVPMEDRHQETGEHRTSKNDEFHGFALYTFSARRPHHGRKHNNQSDDEHVDGSVSSKTSLEGASECSVADFLRKEATSNNDFSSNLSGEQETELRTFMAKRLTRGPLFSGSGHISTLEDFFPDQSAVFYYCLLRGGKEKGEEGIENQERFQKELDEYSKALLPCIDKYNELQDVQESFKHLEEWYDENVKYVCRCTNLLKEDLASVVQLGLLGGKLQVDSDDVRMQKDWKMFVDSCNTANVLDSLSNTSKVNHDMNTLRRLLRQAETDHYALYRSYVFLLKCGSAPILLRNTRSEAHALNSEDTLNIIKVLEEFIEENNQFGIEALCEENDSFY